MMWGEAPWIMQRLPGAGTTFDGDLLQDSNGNWWRQVDRCPCSSHGTTGEVCAVLRDGRIYPVTP